MQMSQSKAVHPFINKLIEDLKLIDAYYYTGDYVSAWDIIKNDIEELRPRHHDKKLLEDIDENIRLVNKVRGANPAHAFVKMKRFEEELVEGKAKEIKKRFMAILWDGNYLVDEGYGMYYPAEDKRKVVPDLRRE